MMENNPDGDRGSMLVRCASQSSLDESSQRPRAMPAEGGAGGAASGGGGGAVEHAGAMLGALAALRRERVLCDVMLRARPDPRCVDADGVLTQIDKSMPESESLEAPRRATDVAWVEAEAGAEPGAGAGQGPAAEAEAETETESETVAAHRAVLAACSPYFRAMFTQFDERTMTTITIQNVDPQALETIVEYIYNPDSLRITEDNVQALLSAASLLQVCGVASACCQFLASALAPDNALGIRAFAALHAARDLAAHAARYVERHFLRVAQHDEFLALSAADLCDLLASDSLCTAADTQPNGEEAVLEAALRWTQHVPSRADRLPEVLAQVRLPLLPHEVLVSRAQQPPLSTAAVAVKDLIIEALSFHLVRPARRRLAAAAAAAAAARARPRRAPAAPKMLLVVGGQAPKAIREVESYSLTEGTWRPARELLTRRCRAGLALHKDQIYAVGGFNGTLRVRSVEIYDRARDTWRAGPPLLARRSTLGVAVLNDKIYAVGGFDGATGLSSCEVLDLSEPEGGSGTDTEGGGGGGGGGGGVGWRAVAEMSTRRSSVGVAVLEGALYAVGGYDGAARQCLASVERYDPALDRWETVESMLRRRSGAGVGVVGGALYALGGHDGPAVRSCVEKYSPRTGWQPVASMVMARRNAAVAAHAGRLYVVGGDDGVANLASAEVLDPTARAGAGQWTLLDATMAVPRSYAGVVLVDAA